VTDQTSAHDPFNGYLPKGWSVAEWRAKQESDPQGGQSAARASMKDHVGHGRFLEGRRADPRLRQQHPPGGLEEGLENAFAFPGFVPAYIRPCSAGASVRSAGRALRRSGRYLQDRRR
jgi:urocanate hydratase